MSKVIKISAAIVSALVLLSILLPFTLSLLLTVPAVQNFAVHRAARFASEKLGTTISMDRIRIRLINRVVVEGFYVEGLDGDTLLYAGRLRAPIRSIGLFGTPLAFGNVVLDDAQFWLRADSAGNINVKTLIEKIRGGRPKNPNKNFTLRFGGIRAHNLTYGMRLVPRPVKGDIDFTNLTLRNSEIDIGGMAIVGDSIHINLRKLSFEESSGFRMERLSAHELIVENGHIVLNETEIVTPDSRLSLPYIHLIGEDWSDFKEFAERVDMEIASDASTLSCETLGWFVPFFRNKKLTFHDLTFRTSGPLSSFRGDIADLQTGNATSLALVFSSTGLPAIEKTKFDVRIERLKTQAADLSKIIGAFSTKPLPIQTRRMIARLGPIAVNGSFNGRLSAFDAAAVVQTLAGRVDAQMAVHPASRGQSDINGRIFTSSFDLGRLLDNPKLHNTSLTLSVDGTTKSDAHIDAQVRGEIAALGFNGYDYSGIHLDGRLSDRRFDGIVSSSDPNFNFDFRGTLDFNEKIPDYDFALKLYEANLVRLGFNQRDSLSQLSLGVVAHASGISMDDLNGQIAINDLVYRYNADTLRSPRILLEGQNSDESKSLALSSSFLDAEFKSRLSYRYMYSYLRHFLRNYLPILYEKPGKEPPARMTAAGNDANAYSLLKIQVKDVNPILGAIAEGMQVAEGTNLSFLFNPEAEHFSLSAKSDFIEYHNLLVTHINVNSNNAGDSLALYVNAEDFYAGNFYMPNLALQGGARGGRATLSTRLSNPKEDFSALLGLVVDMRQNEETGLPQLRIRFTPSHFSQGRRTWYVGARDILYDSTQVVVDRFIVTSEGQELSVNGIASRSREDTMHISLVNFDVSPLLKATERMGYQVEAVMNGHVDLVSALDDGLMNAWVSTDNLFVNGKPAAPLLFESNWDFQTERVRFDLENRRKKQEIVKGFFSPRDGRFLAEAAVDSIDLSLLDPILGTVIDSTKGYADARLQLTGTMKAARINGTIKASRLETTVLFNNVVYALDSAVIDVKDNRLKLRPNFVRDPEGHRADIDLTVDLNHLKNILFDVRLKPDNMLVLNTTEEDNDTFYGKVYASGLATIHGDRLGTTMNIAATTNDHSIFYLPLGGKSDIVQADWIVFRDLSERPDTLSAVERKKLMFERRNRMKGNKGTSSFSLNMTVNVTPAAEFQLVTDPSMGDGIRGRGQGTINIHLNPQNNEFSMYGDCEITEGSYMFSLQNIVTKRFTIGSGSTITWTGQPENALLNMTAIYRLKTSLAPLINSSDAYTRATSVDCILRLSGRLSQPDISFDIQLPNADTEAQSIVANLLNTQESMTTQFFWLLAFGSFYSETGSTGTNVGTSGTSAMGFEMLSNTISNWLSNNDFNVMLRYIPSNEMSGDEFDFGFSKGLVGNRLFLEIEGNYVSDREATGVSSNASNLSGDFYLTWLIDRQGNLKLKVFSQTIDRWDENQGLQESGIGIYYKKDFNTFGDVVRGIKERFANFGKRKRERRAQKEAEKAAQNTSAANQSPMEQPGAEDTTH